ncbi:PaaX family transcriptional regulator C-terminal domain-containing protein [Salinarimonas sp.]|uniref:PaaX family transcriptional regulator n=1 Tax=Salinarimonas sp. TaxID=2766526 RepID=UPI00391C7024
MDRSLRDSPLARALGALIADFGARRGLRAGSFIVTLYGDLARPRGGALWMGAIVEICAGVGISESLTRTAVSRLVEAGQLEGERIGRRSRYRLTARARAEFEAAARVLYGPDPAAEPVWTLVAMPAGEARAPAIEALSRRGFGHLGAGLAARPGDLAFDLPAAAADGLVFRAEPVRDGPALAAIAAAAWDLDGLSAEYRAFRARFAALEAALDGAPDPAAALCARLLLVHDFRRTALRDPQLPAAALPADWAGHAARAAFRRLHARLSSAAEPRIAALLGEPLESGESITKSGA